MTARALPPGTRGFDANAPVSFDVARLFVSAGYRFAVRYLPRLVAHANDLTATEVRTLHSAGLAVMGVQHVESESSWTPTDDKGRQYGGVAADHALACGLALGSTVWLDLEGVMLGTPAEQIIRYCNYWHDRVKAAGFQPGIYVGWHAGLSATELFRRLKFERYWAAYNLNADQYPAQRGICMRQGVARLGEKPAGVPFEIDTDVAKTDALGGTAMVHAPDEWAV